MGHTQCVSVLLNMGVTPNPLDMEGGSPLDYAKQTGHKGTTLLQVFPVIVQGIPYKLIFHTGLFLWM